MGWLNDVLKEVDDVETPENYLHWASLCAISAVVRNRVWINRQGKYKLFPNIYVMLIGRSGLVKGFPVNLAKKLVEGLEITRVISGRMTIQGLMKDLATAYTMPGGGVVKSAHCFVAAGEFASALVDDPASIHILTDIHDTHAHEKGFTVRLASEGIRILEEPCVTFLGASNQINLAVSLPKTAEGGGFIARTFIVSADKKRKINPLMDEGTLIDYDKLRDYLTKLTLLQGPFKITRRAIDLYSEWYIQKETSIQLGRIEDPTGTIQRIHDQILKLAMIHSLAANPDMLIDEEHIQRAIKDATDCVPGMNNLMFSGGKTSDIGELTKSVIRRLLAAENHKMSRKRLLQLEYGTDLDAFAMDRIAETLIQADFIVQKKEKSEVIYELKEAAIKFFGENKV